MSLLSEVKSATNKIDFFPTKFSCATFAKTPTFSAISPPTNT